MVNVNYPGKNYGHRSQMVWISDVYLGMGNQSGEELDVVCCKKILSKVFSRIMLRSANSLENPLTLSIAFYQHH